MERHIVKAYFEDGDYVVTPVNGTVESIEQYYLNKYFNLGTVSDNMQRCIRLEFLE